MNKIFINSQSTLNRAMQTLIGLDLNKSHLLRLEEHKANRTLAANSLYWVWIKYLADQTGESEGDLHFNLRKDYLSKIYLEDAKNKEQRDWVDLFLEASGAGSPSLTLKVFKLLSTTWANTKQFSDYLNIIDRYFTSNGIQLPKPEDLFHQAMGIRNR